MQVRLWEIEGFDCTKILRGHDHTVSSVRFTPAGDMLVSASRDNEIRLWEVATGYATRYPCPSVSGSSSACRGQRRDRYII